MDEKTIIQSILSQVGLKYSENEMLLREEIHKSSSDLIIRVKNLLDTSKNSIPEEIYKRYSKFLTEVLRLKRYDQESKGFLCCEDIFNEEILPYESNNVRKVPHGTSLWGLHIQKKTKDQTLPSNAKYFIAIAEVLLIKAMAFPFGKIKESKIRLEMKKLKLKYLILKKRLECLPGIRKRFLKFSDVCRKKTLSIKLAEEVKQLAAMPVKIQEVAEKNTYSLNTYAVWLGVIYLVLHFYLIY